MSRYEFISADSISRIGSHHATAYMERLADYQAKSDLKIKADETKQIAEPDYYIDQHTGEKIYS